MHQRVAGMRTGRMNTLMYGEVVYRLDDYICSAEFLGGHD